MKVLYRSVFLLVTLIFMFLVALDNTSDVYGKKPEPTQDPYPVLPLNDPIPVMEVQVNPYPIPGSVTTELEYTHIYFYVSDWADTMVFVWVDPPVSNYAGCIGRFTMSLDGGPYTIYGLTYDGYYNDGEHFYAYYDYEFSLAMETKPFVVSEAYVYDPIFGDRYYAINVPYTYSGRTWKFWMPLMYLWRED